MKPTPDPPTSLPLLPLVLDGVPQGLRRALEQEGVPCCDRRQGPPEGRFVLFDSRMGRRGLTQPGQTAIDVDRLRGPGRRDPFEQLLDQRAAVHQWQIGRLAVAEEIAAVDKRAVRREMLDALRRWIEQQGGVWIRLAPFPFPYRSAFNFRLDYDHFDPDDFASTLAAIAGNESATSHYVNGSALACCGDALAGLRGLDVGSHGFWHHTYRTVEENLRNVGRGIEMLRSAGIEPSGFVAPHGRFNRTLLTALETLGVTHSSEFGLAYDELPFAVGSGAVLQIPIHPVCLELFFEASAGNALCGVPRKGDNASPHAAQRHRGRSLQQITRDDAVRSAIDYFRELVQRRCGAGEPALLYGHPTGRRGGQADVLRAILESVASSTAIWRTTLGRFQAWWRARASVRLTVSPQGERLVVAAARSAPGWRLGIEHLRGSRVALLPLESETVSFAADALAYESRETARGVTPARIRRVEGLRGRVRRWIDWELVTPVEQIGTGNWRNWTKRALRRWWRAKPAYSSRSA
jgi:hypothetical protein